MQAVMAQDPDLQRVLANPAMTREVCGLLWPLWPPSRRMTGMNNVMAQFGDINLELAAIHTPTLTAHGTRDVSVPFAHAEHAAAGMPGARPHAVEGAGHLMPFASAAEVDRAVAPFPATLAPAGAE